MRRDELEHIICAAADVARDHDIVVVGSQAILASFPDAPPALLVSQEADVYPRNHPERAIAIDGNMGDGSAFHEAFGYYAHGVGPETAKGPEGWEGRLVPLRVDARHGVVTGWCMEVHDLVLAKCTAGRVRDWDYATGALSEGLVDPAELFRRAPTLPLEEGDLQHVTHVLEGIVRRIGPRP